MTVVALSTNKSVQNSRPCWFTFV